MEEWKKQKTWSDQFIKQIKRILGEYLIGEPPIEEDMKRNTDLIVMKLEAVRIACRIRKHQYLSRFGKEFTIRAGHINGAKTELTKIIEGWGDYFFYGFSNEIESDLEQWIIGDLKAFRIWFNREIITRKGNIPGNKKNNTDNKTYFYSFPVSIPDFVIASNEISEVRQNVKLF